MPAQSAHSQIGEAKTFQRDGFEPACQCFRRLAQKIGRRAAQNQEASWQRAAIRQHPQQGEQFRAALDFVDELPRDPNGKIKKNQLRAPFWEGRSTRI